MVLHAHAVAQAQQPSQPSPPYGLHQAVPAPPQHRLLTPAEARTLMLEEENVVLRRRLEDLKKQVWKFVLGVFLFFVFGNVFREKHVAVMFCRYLT